MVCSGFGLLRPPLDPFGSGDVQNQRFDAGRTAHTGQNQQASIAVAQDRNTVFGTFDLQLGQRIIVIAFIILVFLFGRNILHSLLQPFPIH